MRHTSFFFIVKVLIILSFSACSGAPKPPPKPSAPPPPVDENLLDILPYETDVVLWVNFKTLKTSSLWSLIVDVFHKDQLTIPGQAAINPLFECDEAVLGFWESEQYGSQLLVVAKGDNNTQKKTIESVSKNGTSKPFSAEGLSGVKAKDFSLLSLTKRTVIFGNEAIVRMAAKAAQKKGRALTENPKYDDFEISGPTSAKLRYHQDRNEPLTSSLKNVAPRINPNTVSRIDGVVATKSGLQIDIQIQTETQIDASVIAADLNRTKAQLSKNMMVIFFGIEWLLDRFSVTADKTVVNIAATLDDRDIVEIGRLMNRLQKLREMLGNEKEPPLSQKEPEEGGE